MCKYKIPLKMFCCFTAIKSTKTQPCHVTEIYTQRHSPNTKRSCIHNIQNSSVVTQLCYLIIYFSISYNLVSVGSDVVAKIFPNFHIKGQSLVFFFHIVIIGWVRYCHNMAQGCLETLLFPFEYIPFLLVICLNYNDFQ